MKIYFSHSSWHDYINELYKPIKDSNLIIKHDFYFPHDEANKITNTKQLLPNFDLVLADVSYPTTGQGIELGWADFLGVPIIGICKKGNKYSTALQLVTKEIIEYENKDDMIKKVEERLSSLKK